jgi:hypothetical protein
MHEQVIVHYKQNLEKYWHCKQKNMNIMNKIEKQTETNNYKKVKNKTIFKGIEKE